ncbi:hypothetical protein BGW36DRAFT_359701 [Talaromyces proteolyticus]|uniref:Alpha/beta hydrolase fold-3 domain-containing protein n=1 Tax=Talaromyces proteolyticus TaxID=1131652 RepID=A0AAD4KS47_9EURO|nr:uncharacterized protein BGW36DRAFT_359701 [Talaromyces proteolyticus]KAH8697931.1 hypothetical protein BGW36DRAFT_359701 [Talaromyces proteolyticus]
MADYSQYGDPPKEWTDFLDTTGPLPQTTIEPNQTMQELQQKTNTHREASGLSEKIQCVDYDIPTRDGQTIPARAYRANDAKDATDSHLPIYLFFHRDRFLFGTLSFEDVVYARIVVSVPIIAVNVCYRHTPQFKHSTQANDV